MMEMGMDLVSDIPLTIDNEKIDEDPPSPKCLPLAGHSRFYIVRASQWSPNQPTLFAEMVSRPSLGKLLQSKWPGGIRSSYPVFQTRKQEGIWRGKSTEIGRHGSHHSTKNRMPLGELGAKLYCLQSCEYSKISRDAFRHWPFRAKRLASNSVV